MDWLNILDLDRALANVRTDLVDDWYRDPWNWPEYRYLLDGHIEAIVQRANASGLRPVTQIDVPKENFATRPAAILDPIDRVLYQALVDRQSNRLIEGLAPWVFGWRLPRTEPKAGSYSPNETEWRLYRGELSGLVATNDCGLKTDVVSCFASLPVERICEEIVDRCGNDGATDRLVDMIRSFDLVPGRQGLAQRSKASSTLANMFLMHLDAVLNEVQRKSKRLSEDHTSYKLFFFQQNSGGVTRWMDDVWVFGRDEATLRSVQLNLEQAARDAELELNIGKTKVLEGGALTEAVLKIQHSGVDEALVKDVPDMRPLEELLDELIADPQNAERSSIRFALSRMRRLKVMSRRDELVRVTPRMPHGADHLARAFRDFGWWKDLQEWYLEYEQGSWGELRWSVANLGAMFPSDQPVSVRIRDRFSEVLADRPPAPLLALTAQRLVSWDKERARAVLRAVLPRADHPFERRIIGLAALSAGEEKRFVIGVLSEFEETAFTLEMVRSHDFRPFCITPDFAANESA